jgi:hypothetical protein
MEFGSTEGGWVYPTIDGLSVRPFVLFGLLLPGLLYLLHLTHKYIQSHERAVVAAWIVAGFIFPASLHSLYSWSLGDLVVSEQANAFYGVALQHDAGRLLANFHDGAANLPLHAKANMPGKILLYSLLESATQSPRILGYLIILLSDLGGVLVYLVVRKLFKDRTSAIYAMILYLLIPAKTYFFPLLNTVTPAFLFLSLFLLLLHLESGRRVYLVLEGISLYVMVVFEPLPLVTGLVFVALLVGAYWQGNLSGAGVAALTGIVAISFLLCHLLMVFVFGFDLVRAFLFAWSDAREFNAAMGRPYSIWVVHNLKDFFFNAGVIQSAVFLALSVALLGKLIWILRDQTDRRARVKAFLTEPETLVTLSFLLVLVVTDLAGVNRGETIRLWIFLAVFVQIIAAHRCAALSPHARPWGKRRWSEGAGRWAFTLLVALTVLQTAVTISMVGFVIP